MSNFACWPTSPPRWIDKTLPLILENYKQNPKKVPLSDLITKSASFPIKFPIESVRCTTLQKLVPEKLLEDHINSAYPIIHEKALLLYALFLLHKREFGTAIEKEFYKNLSLLQLIQRLLKNRAVMFMGRFDSYLLLDGTRGAGKWDKIGKDENSGAKLTLENYISYDEIKLSVFLSVSSYSYFINNGTRKNLGKVAENRSNIEDEGVIIGIIGARLKKAGFMEYQELVINKVQNTTENGYEGSTNKTVPRVFLNFYEETGYTYNGLENHLKLHPSRFRKVKGDDYFDNLVYSKRIALSIDTLLIEANERAKSTNTTAFIHVVGIGLGVWKCSPHQEEVFVETFAARVKYLGKRLSGISDLYFSYFTQTNTIAKCKHGDTLNIEGHAGINIFIGKRDPHEKLTGQNRGKLLVVSYAWDGNALPGNEFWSGKLGSTGDSAAAASTQITEIQNSHINACISIDNLRVATIDDGLMSFNDYQVKIKSINKRKHSD